MDVANPDTTLRRNEATDLEHTGPSPVDGDRLTDLLRVAGVGGTGLLVRLPTADPAKVRKAFDAGVRNLFVSASRRLRRPGAR